MAGFHGKTAKAWWGSTGYTEFANITEWSCSLIADVAESHSMHATSFGKTREVGFKGGTAVVTCFLAGEEVVEEDDTITLELWRTSTSTDKGYSGSAIVTGIDFGVDKDGIETISYSFQFTGTVTSTLGAS